MAKKKNGSEDKSVLTTIPADYADLYDWLGQIKANLKSAAEAEERKSRADRKIERSVDEVIARYRELMAERDAINEGLKTLRDELKCLWARGGLAKAEGVTVTPTISLGLDADKVLAAVNLKFASMLVSHEPVFNVDRLLCLVEAGAIPQDVMQEHVQGELDFDIKRVNSTGSQEAPTGQ